MSGFFQEILNIHFYSSEFVFQFLTSVKICENLLGYFITFDLREERHRLVSTETASIQRNILRQGLCTQEEVLANRKFYFLTKQERGQKAAAEIHRNI